MVAQMTSVSKTIKSMQLDDSYEAIYGGSRLDKAGEFVRERITGFVVLAAGSFVSGEPLLCDEVQPFVMGELGFELCCQSQNYIGVVKLGENLPQWMMEWIDDPTDE